MPRSLYKQRVRHPLNLENSEFSHSLGRKRAFSHSTLSFLGLLTIQNLGDKGYVG
jgi:hypothetical protein